MAPGFLPYGRPAIDEEDIQAVADVLRSDYLTTGPKVAALEEAFANRVGAKHAVVCASGTAALHLASLAAGLGAGDIAVVPALTFLATANAPRYVGAEVAFADSDPQTALITPEAILAALEDAGPTVKALFVVHMNGQSCDMPAVRQLAEARGITLIEDACHAIGTRYTSNQGVHHLVGACAHSDMACFSFHPVKTCTMGEGGIVTTNDTSRYQMMCRMRSHGMVREPQHFLNKELGFAAGGAPNPWYYEMQEIGYHHRATDIQCALGLSQLKKFDGFAARRKELVRYYDSQFSGLTGPATAFKRMSYCDPVLHLYVLLIDFEAIGKDRGQVMRELHAKGIGTQVHYLPVHRQPYYVARYGEQHLPGADAYYAKALSIPLYPTMRDEDAERVVAAVREVLGLH